MTTSGGVILTLVYSYVFFRLLLWQLLCICPFLCPCLWCCCCLHFFRGLPPCWWFLEGFLMRLGDDSWEEEPCFLSFFDDIVLFLVKIVPCSHLSSSLWSFSLITCCCCYLLSFYLLSFSCLFHWMMSLIMTSLRCTFLILTGNFRSFCWSLHIWCSGVDIFH